jgi:hypothetical protein
MQNPNPPKLTSHEYEVHDFSQLQSHINEALTRVRQLTSVKKSEIFGRYVRHSLALFGGLSLCALLLSLSYWLAFGEPRPETKVVEVEKPVVVVKEKVVEIEKPVYIAESSALSGSGTARGDLKALQETIERLQKESLMGRESTVEKIVRNYTIFRTVKSEVPGVNEVISGAVFDSSQDAYPKTQYCYLRKISTDPTSSLDRTLHVAKKLGRNNVMYHDIKYSDLVSFGAAESDVKRAQSSCYFY